MTSALPTNISYGTVKGRFATATLTSGDADGFPNLTPATGLTVTFTAGTASVLDKTASPAPVTIEMVPIVCALDSSGYLIGGDGQRGVQLIATNDTDLDPNGWTWHVTFLRAGAKPAAFRDFDMSINGGVEYDITLTSPVPSATGVSLSQAQSAELAAVAAASAAAGSATTAITNAATATTKATEASASAASAASAAATATASKADKVDGVGGFAAKIITRVGDMAIGLAGDSTGDASTEWFPQTFLTYLIARPWLDCNYRGWNNTTQALGSSSVVKAGTGTQTIELYNGSFSTSVLTYQASRLAAMYPVALDLLFISASHNYTTDDAATFLGKVDTFVAAFRALQPQAGIVIVAQNPRVSPATDIDAHATRVRSLRSYAAQRGFGYLPVHETFLSSVGGGSSLLLTDGINPTITGTVTGTAVWADVAVEYLNAITWQ